MDMKPIRNSAKALIIQDGKLLCTKNKDQFGIFYLLPGGGQEPGETIVDALKRECQEEISAEIAIGDLLFVREYIGKNHEFAEWDSDIHQIEFIFSCALKSPIGDLKTGNVPDVWQIGIEWIELSRLNEYRIYPSVLKSAVTPEGIFFDKVYLGDVN